MADHDIQASLRPFFEPGSVAVIGASRTPGKGGYNIIENLVRLGYGGRVYPVNPRAQRILGFPAYARLQDVPATPDLAIIILPPDLVLDSLRECAARGIGAVIIESAGFGEMDESGARVQDEMARLARETGTRVMGPNSVGTINPYTGFDASLGRLNELFLPEGEVRRGHVGFIGQTGLFTGVFLPLINDELGISKVACLGNKCDVDESDCLEYLGADPATRVIAMYLESVKDGQRFLGLARRIVPEKPVIVLKSAVTAGGARVSATHTASIAGEDRIYDAAFRQAGVIRVKSFNHLWDTARAFVLAPPPRGDRVAIVNLAGSGCVITVDALLRRGLKIAELSPATEARIKTVYPDWWRVRSPIDVWTAVEASGFEAAYTTTTRAALEDDGVDAVVVILGAIDWLPGRSIPDLFGELHRDFPEKPLLAVSPLGDREVYIRLCRGFQAAGIPSYDSDEAAIDALAAMWRRRRWMEDAREL
jgi:acyl-CoA synthetase (NDP forming)